MAGAIGTARARPNWPAGGDTGVGHFGSEVQLQLPTGSENEVVRIGRRDVQLTNLDKIFWPELGLTKRDLLQYYADISPWLLPHVRTARW